METNKTDSQISAAEAAASLAAVADSRSKAKRADYPVWFWLGAGAALVTLVVFLLVPLAEPWPTVTNCATIALAAGTYFALHRVRRMRGPRTSATAWWELLSLVPVVVVMVVAGLFHRFGPWQNPFAGLLTAVVVFVVFVATGLAISTRPTRR